MTLVKAAMEVLKIRDTLCKKETQYIETSRFVQFYKEMFFISLKSQIIMWIEPLNVAPSIQIFLMFL